MCLTRSEHQVLSVEVNTLTCDVIWCPHFLITSERAERVLSYLTLARIWCFANFGRAGWCDPPPIGVSKRSVVELIGEDQKIALAEYSRLVVLFLVLGQYLTQLWQVKGQIFGNSMIFQLYESISAKLSIVAEWDLHQRVPVQFCTE